LQPYLILSFWWPANCTHPAISDQLSAKTEN
jgi:hypothetical protein